MPLGSSATGGVGEGFGGASGRVGSVEGSLTRRTHSASSSVSGVVGPGFVPTGLARRDSEISEKERERGDVGMAEWVQGRKREGDEEGGQLQGAKKKRRVAPVQIGVHTVAESPTESAISGTMDPPSVPPSAEP